MQPLRLVFLGSNPIALPLLDWLAHSPGSGQAGEASGVAQVVAVFTQPDRAAGRGQKISPNAIKQWALARGLPVFQPEKITAETNAELAALGADVALVMAYGHILRDEFIATPRLGTLNLHTSLLPKYRGASPIQTAIANGERETGVTLMRIVRQLDAGPLTDVERVAIAPLDTAAEVETKLSTACGPLLVRALPKLRDDSLAFTAQDEGAVTYCRRLVKDDGVLDFSAPAAVLAARINGLFPWPACSVEIGGQIVKLGLADVGSAAAAGRLATDQATGGGRAPGEITGADADGLLVSTGAGVLRLRRLQRPGGKLLEAAEFLRGFPIAAGTRLASRAMPPLVSPAPFPR